MAFAESSSPLVGEGIAGYMDKGRRSPVVSVGIERAAKKVSIVADAYVPNTEYADYPIQFEFFINRRLFSTQIRSKALPGPVGVDIGTDIATPPFNYTVIGKVIHPNREFSTVIEGAVFASNLISTLDCTLTLPASDQSSEDSDIFTESKVTTAQSGNDIVSLSLSKAASEDGSETVSASTSLTVAADNTAKGTLTYLRDGKSVTISTEGTVTLESGSLSELSQSSSAGDVELKCS